MPAITTAFAQGTHAARPAASSSNAGFYYFEVDTQALFQSTGSAWTQIASGVTADALTTKGDVLSRTSSAYSRLAVGSNDQVLTADSTQSSGLKWATPAGFANPMTTQDDLILGGASGAPGRLGKGSDGQVLTVDPTTHHLVWATPASSAIAVQHGGSAVGSRPTLNLVDGSNVTLTVADNSGSNRVDLTIAASGGGGGASTWTWTAKTANYTITTADYGILADATSGALTITLPTAVGASQRYVVKKKDSSANAVTIATTSSQTIDGTTTKKLSVQNDTVEVASDNANWYVTDAALGDVVQLDYAATTDINNGTTVSANTWTDIGSNQSFTVDDAASLVEIGVLGNVWGFGSASGLIYGTRLSIDSAGTPVTKTLGGGYSPASQNTGLLCGLGTVEVSGLSAGSHTVKVQIQHNGGGGSATGTMYCRAATSTPWESLQIRVTERKRL